MSRDLASHPLPIPGAALSYRCSLEGLIRPTASDICIFFIQQVTCVPLSTTLNDGCVRHEKNTGVWEDNSSS
jgi:hypothetical protein